MTQISLETPEIGKPDKTEDQKIITCFTTVQTAINGNLDSTNLKPGSVTGESLEQHVTGLRLVSSQSGILQGSQGAGAYFFVDGSNFMLPATAGTVKFMPPGAFLRASEFEVPTKTTKLYLQYENLCNATATGTTLLFYVIKLATLTGGAGEIASNWTPVIAASEALFTPIGGASEMLTASVAFPAEGTYTVAVNTTGTTAAASYTQLRYRMYVFNA